MIEILKACIGWLIWDYLIKVKGFDFYKGFFYALTIGTALSLGLEFLQGVYIGLTAP